MDHYKKQYQTEVDTHFLESWRAEIKEEPLMKMYKSFNGRTICINCRNCVVGRREKEFVCALNPPQFAGDHGIQTRVLPNWKQPNVTPDTTCSHWMPRDE